jgi:hypothetical protein
MIPKGMTAPTKIPHNAKDRTVNPIRILMSATPIPLKIKRTGIWYVKKSTIPMPTRIEEIAEKMIASSRGSFENAQTQIKPHMISVRKF